MDLFDLALKKSNVNKPLAERMRPRNLNEFFGQKHIIGKGKLLRRLIETDNLTSIILYGPPGVGKTTLAYIISLETKSEFVKLNATSAGVKEIREYIKKAEETLKFYGKRTIVFIDEIHSLKKGAQQDALLDAIEKGTVILIGATTENPYFEINRALLSRSKIFQLESLKEEEIVELIQNTLKDETRGYGKLKVSISKEAINIIANLSGGDGRASLNTLELAILSTPRNNDGVIYITKDIIKECIQKPMVNYDATGDNHYDITSAFIKSIRGSNPDAALYWFGRMILGGEDPRFIVRRLIVHASEDIGMKDPNAMNIAHAAWNALETVGMPEARIPIAEAIIYLATAPKSNSVLVAVDKAIDDARVNQYRVPNHLRDTHYKGSKELGSIGYKYPYDYEENYVKQDYFPKEMKEKKYYKEK
ncbi:ATPase AAA [Clostridium novyi A str. 4552]|uniref:Replication-associated recombination protein A n=1 Tax=Clostridium novyi A str. 4552 TaxID=1444289 RepID=A0A0A0I7B3_CLONO|nr:replication-associated recombination protein A [Clostridium novyi]KGM96181.1 ATPase AAA [Clostridium novyi A str. 4552]